MSREKKIESLNGIMLNVSDASAHLREALHEVKRVYGNDTAVILHLKYAREYLTEAINSIDQVGKE